MALTTVFFPIPKDSTKLLRSLRDVGLPCEATCWGEQGNEYLVIPCNSLATVEYLAELRSDYFDTGYLTFVVNATKKVYLHTSSKEPMEIGTFCKLDKTVKKTSNSLVTLYFPKADVTYTIEK